MRHPNAFPDMRNPREVRSLMHNTYSRYVHGQDMYPKIRLSASWNEIDELPRKTQDIARTLAVAWAKIDIDQAYFNRALSMAVNLATREDVPMESSRIIVKAGINAVRFAAITPDSEAESGLRVLIGESWVEEFNEKMNDVPMALADGRVVRYIDGDLAEDPPADVVTERLTGATTGVFIAHSRPEAVAAAGA